MLYKQSSRMNRKKHIPTSTLSDIEQDPQRVLDLARSEQIQQFWDSETDRSRELGVVGSPTFVAIGNCSGASFVRETEP
jgi:2-hydroxychromene-2-carboxylate isomerase